MVAFFVGGSQKRAKKSRSGPDTSTNPFPHNGRFCLERTGAVKGAPLLGAA